MVAYLSNGWDVNDNEDGKLIFGGRLGFEHGMGVAAELSAIQNDNDDFLSLSKGVWDRGISYGPKD